jgi:anti-sigma factor (TIGR02949 family)
MSSPCDRVRAQLDAYLSRELPEAERAEVERHLATCPQCAAELEGGTRLRAQLQTAVRATAVPSGLEARVRGAVRRQPARPPRTGLYAVAAAAAIIVCVYMIHQLRVNRNPEDAILAKDTGRFGTILNIGLRDHLTCAVFRKYSKQPEPAAQMAAELGPEFAGLVPLIQTKLPADFRIIQAHRCNVAGRQYVHFIIRAGGKLMSVILTRAEPGEWLDNGIQQTGVDHYQVVGFESQGELAYVISDMDAQQNLLWAANLAPTLRQYLATHPG